MYLPTRLSVFVAGGHTVEFVKQLLRGAQDVATPLSVVNVTFTLSLGTPMACDANCCAIVPSVTEQVLPGLVQLTPFTAA